MRVLTAPLWQSWLAHRMTEQVCHTSQHRRNRARYRVRYITSSFSRRLFNVVVTNVPGPQVPLYAAGARMIEMFPVVPLAKTQALSIGVTSYDGGVYFGLNADRDAMSDVDVLAAMVEESVEELMGTVSA